MRSKKKKLFIFFFIFVLVYAKISLLQVRIIHKTGLAASKVDALKNMENSIAQLETKNDPLLRSEIGKKLFEYDLMLAKFQNVRLGNEPFLLDGSNRVGVVLIHGFSASPYEVRELAEYLNKNGNITVYAPLLAGHGTNYNEFGAYTWEDWYESINRAYKVVDSLTDEVYIGGISLGGSLALEFAKNSSPDGVFAIGAPIYYRNKLMGASRILQYFVGTVPNDKLNEEEKKYYYYNRSVVAAAELMDFTNYFKRDLDKVKIPVLLLQSDDDLTIDPKSAYYIYQRIGSQKKSIKNYPGESHIIINKEAKRKAFKDILVFIIDIDKEKQIDKKIK